MKARAILLFILILLLVFGCAYGKPYTPSEPRGERNCAKFSSDYTAAERAYCLGR